MLAGRVVSNYKVLKILISITKLILGCRTMVNSNWDLGFSRRVFLSEEYLGACGHSYIQPYGRS